MTERLNAFNVYIFTNVRGIISCITQSNRRHDKRTDGVERLLHTQKEQISKYKRGA